METWALSTQLLAGENLFGSAHLEKCSYCKQWFLHSLPFLHGPESQHPMGAAPSRCWGKASQQVLRKGLASFPFTHVGEQNVGWQCIRQHRPGLGRFSEKDFLQLSHFSPSSFPLVEKNPTGSDGTSISLQTHSQCLQEPHPQGHRELIRLQRLSAVPSRKPNGAGQLYKRWLSCS